MKMILFVCLIAMFYGCGDANNNEPVVDLQGVAVLYSGTVADSPFANELFEIADKVKRCMDATREDLPKITFVDGNFKCRTKDGWVDAWGCYDYNGNVTLSFPKYEIWMGQPWAHELTHFYGDHGEENACGQFGWGDVSVIVF